MPVSQRMQLSHYCEYFLKFPEMFNTNPIKNELERQTQGEVNKTDFVQTSYMFIIEDNRILQKGFVKASIYDLRAKFSFTYRISNPQIYAMIRRSIQNLFFNAVLRWKRWTIDRSSRKVFLLDSWKQWMRANSNSENRNRLSTWGQKSWNGSQ